jgi:hypothetical protein
MAMAYLFTHFEMENYHTNEEDIVSANDLGAPFPKRDSKGLRVKVCRIKDAAVATA